MAERHFIIDFDGKGLRGRRRALGYVNVAATGHGVMGGCRGMLEVVGGRGVDVFGKRLIYLY